MLETTDFSIVLSGGSDNESPARSIGGEPSLVFASDVPLNNLFPNILVDTTAEITDYRCIYLFNDNLTDILYRFKIGILSQKPGGATIQIGVKLKKEIQEIRVSGTGTGGTCVVTYNGMNFDLNFNGDYSTVAFTLQTWMQTVDPVGNPTVDYESNVFSFIWQDYRYQSLLILTGQWDGTSMVVVRTQSGSPINGVAPLNTSGNNAPQDVTFSAEDIVLNELRPTEGIPIWIKRTIPQSFDPVDLDEFILMFSGSSTP